MTSEGEARKTSEFLRRRKLRLQQVREQSKDIAKLIRQRAEVEKLKQVVELDAKKDKVFLQNQEKVVQKLEQLYFKGLHNVGTSHTYASGLSQPDLIIKTDLAQLRGKEAAAKLKRKKQEKLDEQKKSLERKAQAREAANVISREKSTAIANKLSTKSSTSKFSDEIKSGVKSVPVDKSDPINLIGHRELNKELDKEVSVNDMATQWDSGILPNEWEPNIPALAIPKVDSTKENPTTETENRKRPNLFAISDEMPSSLRGTHHIEKESFKPSLTLVSEYIQNRALRLREPGAPKYSKKQSEDLQTIKQTILRTRSTNPQGSAFSNICHVLEGQVIPVPTWHAETCCQYCSTSVSRPEQCPTEKRQYTNITKSQINEIFSSIRPGRTDSGSIPVLRRVMPFLRKKYSTAHRLSAKLNNPEQLFREGNSENGLTKKKSVTMYNHSTRDTRDVPYTDERMVVRDTADKDAYSEALNETAVSCDEEKRNKNIQDVINKVATTRQHVEREYKETMAFLNDLPKNKGHKPINKAYKDERRLQMQRENRQRTLQQEFKKVEKESGKGMTSGAKSALQTNYSKKSSSVNGDNYTERDFQYSWMPVPEGDGNLAVHTIPTAVKEGKTGNCVKFSKVDSYHEYRSRHKHTPPTKDTCGHDKKVNKRYVEAVIIQQKDDDSLSGSAISFSNGSIEDLRVDPKENENTSNHDTIGELTDAERIIIYKILNFKNKKIDKSSKKSKAVDITHGSSDIENAGRKLPSHHDKMENKVKQRMENLRLNGTNNDSALTTDNLDEGLYKIDQAKGDNITTMYYADGAREMDDLVEVDQSKRHSSCKQNINIENQFAEGQCRSDTCSADAVEFQRSRQHCNKSDDPKSEKHTSNLHSSQIPSTTSFKTATNIKLDGTKAESGFAKLVDEDGKEKGNIYIGATGLLKDDAYEVVIQLRKKGAKNSVNREEMTKSATLEQIEKNISTSVEFPDTIRMEPETVERYSEPMDHPQSVPGRQHPVITTNKISVTDLANNDMSTNPKGSSHKLFSSNITKHDKSVFTPHDVTNNILNEVPETKTVPTTTVAATSASTQTTHASPNPKPVFVHMSSSTSTAYMSPPEVIFPKYFRRGYESSDDAYQHFDQLDDRHINDEQHPYYEKYGYKCKCRRCLGHHRAYLKKIQKVDENRLKTPPNTARSIDTATGDDSFNIDRMKKTSTYSSPVSTYRYHKCKFKGNSKSSSKYHKNQSPALPKRNNKTSVLYNRKGKVSSNTNKNTSNSYLNPMIKDYIDKLLSLNREGIKAIQVMNQECSSVNTPADSILNIPSNFHYDDPNFNVLKNKISLEQLKNFIRKQIFEDYAISHNFGEDANSKELESCNFVPKRAKTLRQKLKKKKNGHKVKNLNISKNICFNTCPKINESSTSIAKRNKVDRKMKFHCQSSGQIDNHEEIISSRTDRNNILNTQSKHHTSKDLHARNSRYQYHCDDTSCDQPKTVTSSGSSSPDGYIISVLKKKPANQTNQPINSSTQTSRTIDSEINFMKLAEDKLQNMEKIANLTETCTKRLSNLAKVLEEVRKNKSLAYSQISNSDSTDCDQKSEKPVITDETEKGPNSMFKGNTEKSPTASSKESNGLDSTDYEALLFDIPKDGYIELPHSEDDMNDANPKTPTLGSKNIDYRINNTKCRSKPPPALLRIHLKRTQENVVPHELSTVIEVDSPMSVKLKNQSSNVDSSNQTKNLVEGRKDEEISINDSRKGKVNTALRQCTANNNDALKIVSIDSSEDSKLRMMDLNQFNEIMLRPFISLQEYVQEYYADDVSAKRETISRDRRALEDVSSLHSDGSLPDVVAELLKRKLITEPFKFDSASNVNSNTVSSESTLSVLALSRTRKDKDNLKTVENKENVTETSDTLSISSNPDLENAFKKLGMGWASSTLKKTKERLALSSSSNTSSSSLSQFKYKHSSKQDMPTIVTDSVSSVPNLQLKTAPERYTDISKNAEQQTSLTNSMTVKEFLTKELAKKITFTKSDRNETNEEFVSLLETKMPEELKNSCHTMIGNKSADSVPSGNNNRARTSTPVQIFKSVTYHSSSSSNISNGLFSNADDLSSVKMTSTSMKNHSTSEKDELTVPNYSLKMRKDLSDCSKTDSY